MIEFKNVEIRYGDFVAIDNLNLKIEGNEFFTFLGPSGCGKTTTLRSLVGFIKPSKGDILVNGTSIVDIPIEERKIGMVFQSYALFPTMNVYDNIAFGLRVKKMDKTTIDQKVKLAARRIHLNEDQLYKNVSELSGGQQQRVALARSIVLEPEILCLDEPLSNLDAQLRVELRAELKRLQRDLGITTLYVTHDQEEALSLSDRIAVFNNGYVEQVGSPFDIYNHSQSEFVASFIGQINTLESLMIEDINKKLSKEFVTNKNAFIRRERISIIENDRSDYTFSGKIIDFDYTGVLTCYTLETFDQIIEVIDTNSQYNAYSIGEELTLYINTDDIMQFE